MKNRKSIPIFRFKLRVAFYAMTAMALLAAYIGVVARRGHQQSVKEHVLANAGGMASYDYDGEMYQPNVAAYDSLLRKKMRSVFGDRYYGTIKHISFSSPRPGAKVASSTMDAVQMFPCTTDLCLIDFKIDAETIKRISQMQTLRSLAFYQCIISDEAASSLKLLNNIESLALSDNSASDRVLEQVCLSMKLQDLRLYSFVLDGSCLRELRLLPSLNTLSIYCLPINDNDLEWLAENLSLESLILQGIENITAKGLAKLGVTRTLKSLAIVNCVKVHDEIEYVRLRLPECEVYFSEASPEPEY